MLAYNLREVEHEKWIFSLVQTNIAKALFFPDGNSTFGPEKCFAFGLANFQHEDISRIKVSSHYVALTLQSSIEKYKMSRVRLFLTSKSNTFAMSL